MGWAIILLPPNSGHCSRTHRAYEGRHQLVAENVDFIPMATRRAWEANSTAGGGTIHPLLERGTCVAATMPDFVIFKYRLHSGRYCQEHSWLPGIHVLEGGSCAENGAPGTSYHSRMAPPYVPFRPSVAFESQQHAHLVLDYQNQAFSRDC